MLGLLFTAAVGVLTFVAAPAPAVQAAADPHRRDAAGRAVRDGRRGGQRDAARRLDRHHLDRPARPGWLGQWFSLFPNVETIVAQFLAVAFVVGSYLAAQYVRVWRPRRRGQRPQRSPSGHPSARPAPRSGEPPRRAGGRVSACRPGDRAWSVPLPGLRHLPVAVVRRARRDHHRRHCLPGNPGRRLQARLSRSACSGREEGRR